MANTIEQRGFFWWFNEPHLPAHSKETSIPGLLTITEDGQITVQIDGALCGNDEHTDWTKPRSFPATRRIAGLLATPGDYILLEGLQRTDFSISDESPQTQTFTAESCTKRQFPFPDDYEQGRFIELRVEMTGLEDWLELDMLECLRGLPLEFGKSELEKFAKACATRRNDISHEGGPRGDMDYSVFHRETACLAEALDHLFHALLLHKIGLPRDVLLETVTRSWVAERRIKPALAEVGLNIQLPPEIDSRREEG